MKLPTEDSFSSDWQIFFYVKIVDGTKLSSAEPSSLLFLIHVLWAYILTLLKCFLICVQDKALFIS